MDKARYCAALSEEQKDTTIRNLHSSIHWLLLYKEREDECLESYFNFLMFKIGGLNSLLEYPREMIELLTLLEAARIELQKEDKFDFKMYRKAIFDAQSVIDRL